MDSCYFLHVNRTAGRFLLDYVIQPIRDVKQSPAKEFIVPPYIGEKWTHWGWSNSIKESTYIVSCLRDPVEVPLSYFLAFSGMKTKEDFFKNKINELANLQSKNFITWEDNIVDPLKTITLDKDLIIERLNKVSLLMETKTISFNNAKIIAERILSDIGCMHTMPFINFPENDTDKFRTDGVKELYESLTQSEIDYIKEINYMDIELYEAGKQLFWDPNIN